MSSLLKFAFLIMLSVPFIVHAEEAEKKEKEGYFKHEYVKIVQTINSWYSRLDYNIRHIYCENEVSKDESLALNDDERGSVIKESNDHAASPSKKSGVTKI